MSHRIKILNELVSYLFASTNISDKSDRYSNLNKFIDYVVFLCGNKTNDKSNVCRAGYLESMRVFVNLFVDNHCKNNTDKQLNDTCFNFIVSFFTFLSSGFFDNFADLRCIIEASTSIKAKVNLDINDINALYNALFSCAKYYKMKLNNSSDFCYFSMNDCDYFYNIDIDIDNFTGSKMSEIYSICKIDNNKVYFGKYNLCLLSAFTHEVCHWLQYLEYNVMGNMNNYAKSIYIKNITEIINNIDQEENDQCIMLSEVCHKDNLETGVIYGGTVDQDNNLVFDYLNSKNFDICQSLKQNGVIEYLRYGHNIKDDGFYDSNKNVYDMLLNYSDKKYKQNIAEFMNNLFVNKKDVLNKGIAYDKDNEQNSKYVTSQKKKKKKRKITEASMI